MNARLLMHVLAEERDRWGPWLVVGLGGGIALYFALPSEPPPYLFGITLMGAGIVLALAQWGGLRPGYPFLMLVIIAAGFHLAQLRSHLVSAPVLPTEMEAVDLVAEVVAQEPLTGGVRLLLNPLSIEGLEAEKLPHFVRLVSRGDIPELEDGSRIKALASLAPPPPAAAPGDYDFARNAYFQRIGAVGFTYGAPVPVAPEATGGNSIFAGGTLKEVWQGWWNEKRRILAQMALVELPGQTGAVTAALLTGQRGAISENTNEAMRISGLAHLLAISGLHLGLIAGTSFFLVRALLCLWPALALRWPVKKIAACCALVMAFCYLFLAGATIPTQRAFIMTALVLLAILLDRTALTLRLVAIAALSVLTLAPESLLGASFQMSFAAVIGLIAGYEILRERKVFSERGQGLQGKLQTLSSYFLGVSITTVIATLATAPFAVYHFNALASYSLLANLIAVPLTGFWVMPIALLVLLLAPLGFAEEVLPLMGTGVDLVLEVAQYISALPHARLIIPQMPLWGLLMCVAGGLWLCLWRHSWRFAGLPVFALGLGTPVLADPPDMLVSESFEVIAVAGPEGELALSDLRKARFSSDQWMERRAQKEPLRWPEKRVEDGDWLSCDDLGCLYRHSGKEVAIAYTAQATVADCLSADLLMSPKNIPLSCKSQKPDNAVLSRLDLWRNGGYAFWLEETHIRSRTVREWQGDRPWNPYRIRPK